MFLSPEVMSSHVLDENLVRQHLEEIPDKARWDFWRLWPMPADAEGPKVLSLQFNWKSHCLGSLHIDSQGVTWGSHVETKKCALVLWGSGSHAQLGRFTSANGVSGLVLRLWSDKDQPSVICKSLFAQPSDPMFENLPEHEVAAPWLEAEAFAALCYYARDHVEHWHTVGL